MVICDIIRVLVKPGTLEDKMSKNDSDSVNVTIRVDKELKEEAQELFEQLGISLSSSVEVFLRAAIRCQGFPFRIAIRPEDIKHS